MATVAQACTDILYQITGEYPPSEKISFVQLTGTHQNYRYHWGEHTFHVKMIRNHMGELFSWDSHWRLQSLLAIHSLAPSVYSVCEGVWVEQWLDTIPATSDDIAKGAVFMARIHQLKMYTRDASAARWYPHYVKGFQTQWQNDLVFGHNDMHMGHLFDEMVVDWEYAGITERAYDIANCCVINRWSVSQRHQFLSHYERLIPRLDYNLTSAVNAYIPIVEDINLQWQRNLSHQSI